MDAISRAKVKTKCRGLIEFAPCINEIKREIVKKKYGDSQEKGRRSKKKE
jgi:hypothetical protein